MHIKKGFCKFMNTDFTVRRLAYNLYLEGYGYKAAAKQLGLHESTVRDWFRRFKANAYDSLLSQKLTTKRYPLELKEKVIQLRNDGFSWTQILQETRVPIGTAKNWVRRSTSRSNTGP